MLALQAPDSIHWVVLIVTRAAPEEDLRSRDLLWSLDGVEVFSVKQFAEVWGNRAKDRPLEVVVVRTEPNAKTGEPERRFVRMTLQPGSTLQLGVQGELERKGGLAD